MKKLTLGAALALVFVMIAGVFSVQAQDPTATPEPVLRPSFTDGRLNAYDPGAPVAVFETRQSVPVVNSNGVPTTADIVCGIQLLYWNGSSAQQVLFVTTDEIRSTIGKFAGNNNSNSNGNNGNSNNGSGTSTNVSNSTTNNGSSNGSNNANGSNGSNSSTNATTGQCANNSNTSNNNGTTSNSSNTGTNTSGQFNEQQRYDQQQQRLKYRYKHIRQFNEQQRYDQQQQRLKYRYEHIRQFHEQQRYNEQQQRLKYRYEHIRQFHEQQQHQQWYSE